ncbi:fimbria/pilus periplasmic chaperone [Gallibacterium trehalosifermentans]|uniref:Fimbria/pilus periplasmic chaperone n=1 Tax=Gallibacterium trehalosifermentans TaxID=516935 RepID=A0ABV6GYD5_9PAST
MWKKSIVVLMALWVSASQASIVITGTRVIYPSTQKNVNVQLTNAGDRPSLMQTWIDDGDANASPEQIKTPFLITPPISRIDAKKGQSLRITYTGEPLPQDRESIFYLNVLDIPPKPKMNAEENQNYLQIAIRSRIKLFFRPEKLAMLSHEAYDKVRWSVKQEQGKSVIEVDNPTPYFITYNRISVKQGSKVVEAKNSDMVAPYSKAHYVLSSAMSNKGEVNWIVVNDYGALQTGSSQLQ